MDSRRVTRRTETLAVADESPVGGLALLPEELIIRIVMQLQEMADVENSMRAVVGICQRFRTMFPHLIAPVYFEARKVLLGLGSQPDPTDHVVPALLDVLKHPFQPARIVQGAGLSVPGWDSQLRENVRSAIREWDAPAPVFARLAVLALSRISASLKTVQVVVDNDGVTCRVGPPPGLFDTRLEIQLYEDIMSFQLPAHRSVSVQVITSDASKQAWVELNREQKDGSTRFRAGVNRFFPQTVEGGGGVGGQHDGAANDDGGAGWEAPVGMVVYFTDEDDEEGGHAVRARAVIERLLGFVEFGALGAVNNLRAVAMYSAFTDAAATAV